MAPLRLKSPRGLLHASERLDFILWASGDFCFGLQLVFYSNGGVRPSHKNSNYPLAGEPETENDAARKFHHLFVHDSTSVEAAAAATTQRICSNDQHVDTCGNAWGVDAVGTIRNRRACLCAGAEPGAA
ncbi:hypothetical protein LJR220_005662 [Bradyrhizobium sp. LjRoot220]|uniref:hypothetical protein n=1 Tax=Bradyrhizobium sp. LjRoot220 TaxID=3342284 RepID=UPI003ED1125C